MAKSLCEAASCERQVTEPGRRVCSGCREVVRGNLSRLTDLHEACAEALTPGRRPMSERISGHRPTGITLDDTAVAVRSDVLDALVSWSALVSAERGAPGPGGRSVPRLVEFLTGQLDWLLGHGAGPDFVGEVADLVAAAKAVLEPDPVKRRELGPCGEPGCAHVVLATLRAGKVAEVACAAGHTWSPGRWLLLSRRVSAGSAA
ncbi:hypothetical protein [Umezawaea sp. Da 62-37]|uniref:hypothetical protein n=1 Tax=Umezawaea sp. Da 62-37 TaxID=3075927 RepID=UPI0028F732F3|nr:hypothetical protein [Umezawaea sp. Da 62-37]WNV86433.1 hypothetical protein RM788_51375 [Umezawaea sp. Da 62-37]